jgi:hypothetical protein
VCADRFTAQQPRTTTELAQQLFEHDGEAIILAFYVGKMNKKLEKRRDILQGNQQRKAETRRPLQVLCAYALK